MKVRVRSPTVSHDTYEEAGSVKGLHHKKVEGDESNTFRNLDVDDVQRRDLQLSQDSQRLLILS